MNEPITADLSGQTTVILGGTGNIGEGIVRAHIAAGATVVVPSRDADRIEVVRRALDVGADRLVGIEGDTQTFDGMTKIAEETVDRAGLPTHLVASIGGWFGGQPVWQTDEQAWNTYFVDPSRAHFAAARAFIPRMADGGSYTMILGLSAYLGMPATSPRAMHGGALRMLRQTLSTEVGPQRRVNSLAFAPLLNRAATARRPHLAQLRPRRSPHPGPRDHPDRDRPGLPGARAGRLHRADDQRVHSGDGPRPTRHPGCRAEDARPDETSRMTPARADGAAAVSPRANRMSDSPWNRTGARAQSLGAVWLTPAP